MRVAPGGLSAGPLPAARHDLTLPLLRPPARFVERVKDSMQQKLSAGLLQLVVRWGRPEILANVLRSPSLVEQRQPQQVQQAFNDALKLATSSAYDTKVVNLLLDQVRNVSKPGGLSSTVTAVTPGGT